MIILTFIEEHFKPILISLIALTLFMLAGLLSLCYRNTKLAKEGPVTFCNSYPELKEGEYRPERVEIVIPPSGNNPKEVLVGFEQELGKETGPIPLNYFVEVK